MTEKQANWFRRHWILSIIIGIFVLFVYLFAIIENLTSSEISIEQDNVGQGSESSQIAEQSKVDYFDVIQVTDNKAKQYDPDVYDNIVVWVDERKGNKDVYMKDLKTGEERQITSGEEDEFDPFIYQDKIFYIKNDWKLETEKVKEDRQHGFGLNDIFLFDISTGNTKQITCDGLSKELNDFYNNLLLFSYKEPWSDNRKYLIDVTNNECDQEQEIIWKDYPNEGEETILPFKYLPGRSREGYPSQSSSQKIIGADKFPKKSLICDDYQKIIDGYTCSSPDFEKISDKYLFTPANIRNPNNKICSLFNYANINLFGEDVTYYDEKISEIRKDIPYPCTDIIEDNLIYFKWEEIGKNGHYTDEIDFKIYSLDLTEQNAFYEELTDQQVIAELEDIEIKEWTKCYEWKSRFYSDCSISQKIMSIYNPKTDKLYEIKGDRIEIDGGWYDSWSKVIEEGDLEPLPKIEEVKISQDKIIWTDKRNEKCIDEIGCDENTDIYILQIKE